MPRKPAKSKYTTNELCSETLRLQQLVSSGTCTSFNKATELRNPKFSRMALYRCHKKLQENPDAVIKQKGRPRTLSEVEEKEIVDRLHSAQKSLSHITNDLIVRESVSVGAIKRPDEDNIDAAVSRVVRMGGEDWLHSFKRRHSIKTYEKKRPIEIERAIKSQPEISLNYWRLLYHVHALCQIHRRIASGKVVLFLDCSHIYSCNRRNRSPSSCYLAW